ncbi:MAG: dihydrolipoyl dehydrogenase family protein, partial [Thermodesulfobacteriota bacterium]
LKSNGVGLVKGQAAFEAPNLIQVGEHALQAERFILATGSSWAPLGLETGGSERVVNTDWLLEMRDVPSEILVLGGGPVELEAAQFLFFLGCQVTLLVPDARILPDEDREMALRVSSALKGQGMRILTGTKPLAIQEVKEGVRLRVETKDGEKSLEASFILHAKRRPAVEGLALDRAGLSARGECLPIDAFLRSAQPHILAAGDVTGPPFYSHRASAMALLAAENALGHEKAFDSSRVPRAFYTVPEMASLGLTEARAREVGHKVRAATIPYSVNARAMMSLETEGAVKIVSEERYGEILGVHIVGPHATELISEGILAMELEATVEDLARAIRLHPSLSESQVEAARECMGRGIYVLR